MSGASIAAEVSAAIAQASAEVGNGTALQGTITRAGSPSGVFPFDPVSGSSTPCTLILSQFSDNDRAGGDVRVGDVRAMIATDGLTLDPSNGDRLTVAGRSYNLVTVSPYKPGGVVLYWIAQARGA